MTKLKESVYVDAAERIAFTKGKASWSKDFYACDALWSAVNDKDFGCTFEYTDLFVEYFRPYNINAHSTWFSAFKDDMTKQTQLARQLALLFMAEIVAEE